MWINLAFLGSARREISSKRRQRRRKTKTVFRNVMRDDKKPAEVVRET